MVATFTAGYIFDIVGRRLTLCFSFLLGSIFLVFMPYMAPNVFPQLLLLRCAISTCFAAPASNPLMADYIQPEALGKATALLGVGYIVGEVLSMGVLFQVTARMSHYNAFLTTAIVGGVFSCFFLCLVKEPKLRRQRKSEAGIEDILEMGDSEGEAGNQ